MLTPHFVQESKEERIQYLRAPLRQESKEDALETLKKYNTVIVVDDSGSMMGERWKQVCPNHSIHLFATDRITDDIWLCTQAREALSVLANAAAEYDTDGIDIFFLNDRRKGTNMRVSLLEVTGSISLIQELSLIAAHCATSTESERCRRAD